MNTINLKYAIIPSSVITIGHYAFNTTYNKYAKIYVEAESKGDGWVNTWYGLSYESDAEKLVYFNTSPEEVGFYENFQYIIQNNEMTITGIINPISSLIIPDKINNISVTSIGHFAFYQNIDLRTVKLPEGLITINQGAFIHNNYLTDINIPTTVQSIGEYAFEGCYDLRPIHIPISVMTIGLHAFKDCNKLIFSVERSEIAIGWDITWNNSRPVYWNINEVIIENGFYGIMINDTVIILDYRGNHDLVIIPNQLSGYVVIELEFNSIYVNEFGKVVIPSSVQIVAQSSLYSINEYSYIFVYSETSEKPVNWDDFMIYGEPSCHYIYWVDQWSYVNGIPTLN